ncbi:NDR1/HIN1-like protein 10 [Apium graveolens]|uniref:NDR1/HIN1-like protein 10 n=1 Tax=Apium graveolens TaxID=4045 RepID=UPI003D792E4B
MNNTNPTRPVTGYPAHPNPNGYSSGTAYPYAAAPPPNNGYYTQNPYYNRTDPQRAFIRRLFAIIISCIIISGTVLLIIWLILRPRVPEFRVDSLSVSNFNISSSLLSGNWDVQFTVRNPNKKITVKYDRIDADVFYKSEGLASTTLPPFSQGKRNETKVRATFGAIGAYVEDWVVRDVSGDRGKGSVKFSVRLLARARFKAGAWGTRKRYVRVLCRDVPVGLTLSSGRGAMVGGARECRVVT